MLTGEKPLGRFSSPSQKAKVPSSLDAVLDRALAKDVAHRYQDVREFKQAVEAVMFSKKEPLQKMDTSDWLSQWAGLLAARRFGGDYNGTAKA